MLRPLVIVLTTTSSGFFIGYAMASWSPHERYKLEATRAAELNAQVVRLQHITRTQTSEIARLRTDRLALRASGAADLPLALNGARQAEGPLSQSTPGSGGPGSPGTDASAPRPGAAKTAAKAPLVEQPPVSNPSPTGGTRTRDPRPTRVASAVPEASVTAMTAPSVNNVGQPKTAQGNSPFTVVPDKAVAIVSMHDAGVLDVRPDGLRLKNGKFVKVGEKFETGEVLLSVQAPEKRIQTDQRVLVFL